MDEIQKKFLKSRPDLQLDVSQKSAMTSETFVNDGTLYKYLNMCNTNVNSDVKMGETLEKSDSEDNCEVPLEVQLEEESSEEENSDTSESRKNEAGIQDLSQKSTGKI